MCLLEPMHAKPSNQKRKKKKRNCRFRDPKANMGFEIRSKSIQSDFGSARGLPPPPMIPQGDPVPPRAPKVPKYCQKKCSNNTETLGFAETRVFALPAQNLAPTLGKPLFHDPEMPPQTGSAVRFILKKRNTVDRLFANPENATTNGVGGKI